MLQNISKFRHPEHKKTWAQWQAILIHFGFKKVLDVPKLVIQN